MKQKCKAILIQPEDMGPVTLQKSLAKLFNLDYIEVKVKETHKVKLQPEILLNHLYI